MPGFTPGTGCTRTGVAGSCQQGPYTFYVYDNATAASTLAGLCPSGAGGGGVPAGNGGQTGSSGPKITCYIASYMGLREGTCNVSYYTSDVCTSLAGTVVTTCPSSPNLDGCCKWPSDKVAAFGTDQCYYNYTKPSDAMFACSQYGGEWRDTVQ
jgi:hypothetical protein